MRMRVWLPCRFHALSISGNHDAVLRRGLKMAKRIWAWPGAGRRENCFLPFNPDIFMFMGFMEYLTRVPGPVTGLLLPKTGMPLF